AEVFDAKLLPRAFPFTISDISARIEFDGQQAKIKSFSGRHDETTIRIDGGYARYDSEGEWRLRLDPLFVDDLETTREFRKALPKQLSTVVDALNPRGQQPIPGRPEFRR